MCIAMFIADLHIHSRYSRATSRECVPEFLELWARRKGLDLMGTGDFTHPAWREELKEKLVPAEEGLYRLRDDFHRDDAVAGPDRRPRFVVSGEISSIYKKDGKVRKIHNVILLPSLEDAEALSHRLEAIGNLHSDGRPILGLDSRDLLEITLEACPDAIFIPAHIWTPHFSLFGAFSGFDRIEECFGDLTDHIYAVETGLSSDPPMNWRVSALDRFTLVSNSDAHSPGNLAREANLFRTELSYPHLARALQHRNTREFAGTIEFFPEEGKYHYDGHRNCKVCLKPAETDAVSGVCPVCGGRITVGVLHRVEELADRKEGFVLPSARPFERLIPLREVIAASTGFTSASAKVRNQYDDLLRTLGPELSILREVPLADIERKAGPLVMEGIRRLRAGKVEVSPGYDGEYGKVRILGSDEIDRLSGQLSIFQKSPSDSSGRARKPRNPPSSVPPERSPLHPRAGQRPEAAHAASADIFSTLNEEQREAVSAADPVVAVVAGPGTGKTKTLVSRIVFLVRRCGVSPCRVTAVTFTNRAADEMRTRLIKALGDKRAVKAMTIGTFHSICLQILSDEGKKDIPIIDEPDALSIVEEAARDLHRKTSVREAGRAISLVKSGAQSSVEESGIPNEVYDAYQERLARYGVMDYDDILLRAQEIFRQAAADGGRETRLRKRFSYLLVDEFQDINPVQYRLIREWGRHSAGLFVIGDPDQSIYGFRGSDARCFARFFEDYPRARCIRLCQNYRSTPEILRCAGALIGGKSAGKAAETLTANRKSGEKVRLLRAESDFSEALFVAKEINRMVGGMDMLDTSLSVWNGRKAAPGRLRSFSDIAVLYRTNRQAAVLEKCLSKEGIPYLVAGRDEFLLAPEVRRTIAFFRFLLNPADLISLRLCLKTMGGCAEGPARKVLEHYAASEKSVSSFQKAAGDVWPAAQAGSIPLLMRISQYEPLVRKEKPQKLLTAWADDMELSGDRNMERLLNTAVCHKTMPDFLRNLLIGRESDVVRSGRRNYSPDAVSLMTLHAAKGLEFPVVFICGVKEGCIPLQNHGGDCDMGEERRLFYVGMTRAQDELLLLTGTARSPFLAGLPKDAYSQACAFEPPRAEYEQVRFF